jgi:hypothetical protein
MGHPAHIDAVDLLHAGMAAATRLRNVDRRIIDGMLWIYWGEGISQISDQGRDL